MFDFKDAKKKLNKQQLEAVESLDGPVMVVAGPGTGKTQVLSLRILNILDKTDTPANGILCLTFTRSGATAMRNRLLGYIGTRANDIVINTFHSFALSLIEKYFDVLDFDIPPKLLDENGAVFLVDEILHDYDWGYIKPRANPEMYFSELKSLVSLLKREGITSKEFSRFIDEDIEQITSDPENISTRGESKGGLRKDVEKKIESLHRTKEVVAFYELYEQKKKDLGLIDYDDVLTLLVEIVKHSESAKNEIRENFLYVLIDEHQDSSFLQNNFLKIVWGDVEMPNIFVVGDDRQLIYGFSGASLSYFEEFKTCFGTAKLITLVENYRSASPILKVADDLLTSSISFGNLKSNTKGDQKVLLKEFYYPRDEVIGAGLYFKEKVKNGGDYSGCAILVPKNHQVKTAVSILATMGIPVSSFGNIALFSKQETESIMRVLGIIANPFDSIKIAASLLDKNSGILPIEAHTFLKKEKLEKIQITDLVRAENVSVLFENSISAWGKQLEKWINDLTHEKISVIVSEVGNQLIIDRSKSHTELIENVEIVRTLIHLAISYEEKNPKAQLSEFITYIERLEKYGNNISIASFGGYEGVQVMTLHRSKGLEYKHVCILHVNEETLMSEKKNAFTLPEKIKAKIQSRNTETVKRELYVAITRAKTDCVISFAKQNYNGAEMECARIIADLDESNFIKQNAQQTESDILQYGPKIYTENNKEKNVDLISEIKSFVQHNFSDTKVSVTLLNNFFECPWKWYFRNFLKLPDTKTVSLSLGSVVHSTIEYILKNKSVVSDEVLIKEKIVSELHTNGFTDKKEISRLSKEAFTAVSNWVELYFKDLAQDIQSERNISFVDPRFPELTIYGKIDLTERFPNGDIVVTDFKTGKPKTKNEIEAITKEGKLSDYMRQLAMYSYLVLGNEKKYVAISKLLFLEADKKDKNALYSIHIDQEKIDLLKQDIAEYVSDVQSGNWIQRTCTYKPWGGDRSECPHCAMANKIFSSR